MHPQYEGSQWSLTLVQTQRGSRSAGMRAVKAGECGELVWQVSELEG